MVILINQQQRSEELLELIFNFCHLVMVLVIFFSISTEMENFEQTNQHKTPKPQHLDPYLLYAANILAED